MLPDRPKESESTPKAEALRRLAEAKATLTPAKTKETPYRPYIDYEVAVEEGKLDGRVCLRAPRTKPEAEIEEGKAPANPRRGDREANHGT